MPIHGRQHLGSGLRWYLIIFDPQTFVLDQRKGTSRLLSLLFCWRGSTDFTPTPAIRPAPIPPIDHCPAIHTYTPIPMGRAVFQHSLLQASKPLRGCFERSHFLKVLGRIGGAPRGPPERALTGGPGPLHQSYSRRQNPAFAAPGGAGGFTARAGAPSEGYATWPGRGGPLGLRAF